MNLPLAVSATTSFAEAMAQDEAFFDRLIAYHPGFRQFAAVMMREDVAARLALSDISNMAGVPVAHVMEIASGRNAGAAPSSPPEPAYSDARRRDPMVFEVPVRSVDVRADLDNGHEPLGRILDTLGDLRPSEDLVVETTFHAVPLRRLLSGRGFASLAEQIGERHWRIRFRKEGAVQTSRRHPTSCCGACGGQ